MVVNKPYVHWKIKDTVDFDTIDPVYLWGTIVETDKGPIDEPVFIRDEKEGKKIFNYDFAPFFANGGRHLVVMRAYSGTPTYSTFDIKLDQDFSYVYINYKYYPAPYTADKVGYVYLKSATAGQIRPELGKKGETGVAAYTVRFEQGRWRRCELNGDIRYYYVDENDENEKSKLAVNIDDKWYEAGATAENILPNAENRKKEIDPADLYTKSFNESDVEIQTEAKLEVIAADTPLVEIRANYPGDFSIPISIQKDIRNGYRISIKESDDYSIMLSGATTLDYIVKRINERAQNISAKLTEKGEKVQKVFSTSLIPAVDGNGDSLPQPTETTLSQYNDVRGSKPVGAIFAKVKNPNNPDDTNDFEIVLSETVAHLADGSNGDWDKYLDRIADPNDVDGISKILNAHRNALDHLATIKLSGIFCNYGEDQLQKVYADHVSTTEPQGMNSAEVCKWRSLIVGANATDRTNEPGDEPGFKLADKAVAFDNENILFLGQGLIDDGYIPRSNVQRIIVDNKEKFKSLTFIKDSTSSEGGYEDPSVSQYQLLPFQCTQYIAGLRSKLFYGDAIFGGEAKKAIRGVGNITIAPLFAGENKILWQPDTYVYLNEHGVLTFTEDYNILSLTDGVTTRRSPLEEDEEGVQSIVKFAKHAVHEVLQTYIGRNITSDLQTAMESSIRVILNAMQTQDQTLLSLPGEGYNAFDIDIVLVPKSNAKQILAKAYVYLKLTPVHALRQIEVELTVQ